MAPSIQIPRLSIQSRLYNLILLTILTFSQAATASLSLQELQPIAHFPAACQSAYQIPIQSCPDASSFSINGGSNGPGGCTQDCFNSIGRAVANIQQACQGSAAPPGTVIAHAFSGDLASFLCGGNGGNSQPTSDANPTTTATSTTGGNTSKPSAAPTSQGSTDTRSSASSTSPSSTNTSSSPSSTSTRSNSSTTTQPSTLKSSSSTSQSTQATLNAGGGGSPFDQTVPNAAPTPITGQNILSFAVGVAVAVALGS